MTKTSIFTRSMLLKSLSAFTISMLGQGINKAFFKATSETLFASDHHMGTTLIHPPHLEQQAGISSTDPGLRAVEGVTEMGWGVYESYIWFMGMMLILEIVISSIKVYQKKQISDLNSSKNLYKARESVIVTVKRFIVDVIRMIFILTFYYLSYMIIFASLCFACNLYNNQGTTLMRQEPALNNLAAKNSEAPSLHLLAQDIKKRQEQNTRTQRMSGSSALSSQIIFAEATNSVLLIGSMLSTGKGDIVLVAAYSTNQTLLPMGTLNIINLTTTTFPSMTIDTSTIGTVLFFWNHGKIGPLSTSNNTYPLSLAMSSDGTTVFMTTPSALQIYKFVDGTSLENIHTHSMSSTTFLYSVTLSPDDKAAFLLEYSASAGYQIKWLDLTDLTNIESKEFTFLNSSQPLYSLYTYEQSMFVSVSSLSFWWVYNISDMNNITFQGELDFGNFDGVQSVAFSSNYQTAYVGTSLNGFGYISIVNISGGVISNTISTTPLVPEFDIDYLASIVESPDGRRLFIGGTPTLQIFDISDPTTPTNLAPTDTPKPVSMVISENGQKGIFAGETGYYAIYFSFNVELNQAIDLQSNVVGTISISSEPNAIAFSPNSSTIYISINSTSSNSNSLLVMNVSNPSNYTMLPSFPVSQPPIQMNISLDGKYLFALSTISVGTCKFEIYSIFNAKLLSPYYFNCSDISTHSFVITPDSNTAIIVATIGKFIVLDITNKKTPKLLKSYTFSSKYAAQIAISPDGTKVYVAGSSLNIYNISTPSSTFLIQSLADLPGPPVSIAISDELTFTATAVFLVTKSTDNTCYLNVINTVAIKPVLFFSLELNDNCAGGFGASALVPMLPYGQTLFISLESSLIAVEMTDCTQPRITGVYSSPDSRSNIIGVSPGSSTIFTGTSQGLTMITLKPKHILYVDPLTMLGLPTTPPLVVFSRNDEGTYDTKVNNYKFANVSLYSASSVDSGSLENIVFGNWVNFDYNTGVLSVSSFQTESLIGSYVVYASLSTQIPNTIFSGSGIDSINNIDDSIDLMVALVGLGYIDNEGYLTSSFDPDQTLLLGSEYMDDEVQIRSVMAKYSIQAWTRFINIESLYIYPFLGDSPNITISTLSSDTMTVNITLENAQFVTLGYSFSASFSPDNRQVILIGLLDGINDALSQLTVFLNGSKSSNGSISVTDGLNPNIVKFIPDISSYFQISTPPIVDNDTFLDQLGSISPTTGFQFFVQFSEYIFTDSHNQPLTFCLEMQDNSSEVPIWLEFKELSLVGTPPMQLTGRDLELKVVVSNQYQSTEVNFTLSVSISFEYVLEVFVTYGGAIITLIGLYVYAGRIYNIFAKNVYTYPKKFVIRVGEKVTAKTLYPIAFHGLALQESRLIMSHLDKRILSHLKNTQPAVPASSSGLAGYFCKPNSYKLDQSKLCQMIEEAARETRTKLYTKGKNTDRKLIQQLIINNFVIRVLDLKEEKSTKVAFEKIKREIFSLVDLEKCMEKGCCKFFMNKAKLQAKLRDYKIKTFSLPVENEEGEINVSGSEGEFSAGRSNGLDSFRSPHMRTQKGQRNLEEELLIPNVHPQTMSGANIDLLTDVIEAYAFNSHILDTNVLQVDIVVTQKMTNISVFKTIRKFLKWDLKLISSDKEGAIACGIEYQIKENILYFCGTANQDFGVTDRN